MSVPEYRNTKMSSSHPSLNLLSNRHHLITKAVLEIGTGAVGSTITV